MGIGIFLEANHTALVSEPLCLPNLFTFPLFFKKKVGTSTISALPIAEKPLPLVGVVYSHETSVLPSDVWDAAETLVIEGHLEAKFIHIDYDE